jgi:non-ribosomal peptide synthetase component F
MADHNPAIPSGKAPNSSALSNLTPGDQFSFYRYGLGPERAIPTPVIHHAFEAHARTQPDAIAVEHMSFNHSLTYHQLDVQANRLARRLHELGIAPGKRVCILARRSVYLIVAILAVLKSGGQYVPLDAVTITDSTLGYVLNDSKPSAVLVMNEFAHRLNSTVPTLPLEDIIHADKLSDADAIKPADTTNPSDGAYVVYTSGTTGVPKGVDVKHRGVTNGLSVPPLNIPFPFSNTLIVHSNKRIPWQCRNVPWYASRPTAQYRVRL